MSVTCVRSCRPASLTTIRDGLIKDSLSSVPSLCNRCQAQVPFSDVTFSVAFCTIIIARRHNRRWHPDDKNELFLDFSTVRGIHHGYSLPTPLISRPDKFRKVSAMRILLADDHKIVRQGIKLYLEGCIST